MAKAGDEKWLAQKLIELRKATEDYETARELLRDSERLMAAIRKDVAPYMKFFASDGRGKIQHRHSPRPHPRAARVDYGEVAKAVERAGGHCSVGQYARLLGLTHAAAYARLMGAVEQKRLTVTHSGRLVVFHTPTRAPAAAAAA